MPVTRVRPPRGRGLALTLLLAATAAFGAAPQAGAAVLTTEGDTLVYRADPGERNSPILSGGGEPGVVEVSEVAAIRIETERCVQPNPNFGVQCQMPARVRLELGDLDDNLDFFGGWPAGVPVEAFGGDGADLLEGNFDAPTPTLLDGQGGPDKLEGMDGPETLAGGPGSDELIGKGGDDVLRGGEGSDVLAPDGGAGEWGDDVVDGGPGVDLARDWTNAGGNDHPPVSLSMDGQANDGRPGERDNVTDVEQLISNVSGTFSGSEGADEYDVYSDLDEGSSSLLGHGGDDKLTGGDHVEQIDGGAGDDRLEGGYGNDTIAGGPGRDTIFGDDTSSQCGFLESCIVPFGNDAIEARDGEQDVIDCGVGQDRAVVDAVDVVSGCEDVQGGAGAGMGPGGSGGESGGDGKGDAGGESGGDGEGGGPAGEGKTPALTTPRGQRLKTALRKGLTVRVANAAGPVALTAGIDKATARKARLGRRALAVAKGRVAAGKPTARLRFTKAAARRLRRLKKVTLTVRAPGAAPLKLTLR